MTTTQVQRTAFSVTITATTPVSARPERVWEVLTETEQYPSWNPFVRRLTGTLEAGERIEVDLDPTGDKVTTMRPRLVAVVPGRSFTWLGRVGVAGVLDGRHSFTVEPAADGTAVLVQHERLSGALVPLFRSLLTVQTPRAFEASNEALAARATA